MTKSEFILALQNLNIDVDDTKINMLENYYKLLIEYNSHTNVTSIIDKEDVYLKHFYDSLTLSKAYNFNNNIKVLDIGSGAGFPGLILKIFFPSIMLTVLDSNNKKTKFMELIVTNLELKDVEIVNNRAEEYAKDHLNEFDVVTSRAVAFIDIITEISLPFVKKDGKLILMKGDFEEEEVVLRNHMNDLNVINYQIINFDLPNTEYNRNLVIINKKENCDKILSYSQIIKRNKKWNNK